MRSKRKQEVIETHSEENIVKSKKIKDDDPPKKKKTQKVKKKSLDDDLKTESSTDKLENNFNDLQKVEEETKESQSKDSSSSDPPKTVAQPTDCLWPGEDLTELLRRMEETIPPHDKLRFKLRVARLDWDSIAFGNYSADDCRRMWDFVQRHVRCYRLLTEIIDDAKKWAGKPWTSYRANKRRKHPDKPRRPLTSYMIFYVDNKNKVLKKNPNMDMPSLSRHIAELYKNLTPAKKEKYLKLAAEQREEYNKKLQEFYDKHPDLLPIRKAQRLLPKKPFKIFYESKVEQAGPDVDKNELLEKCKKKWKSLSDKKKSVWIELALKQTDSRFNGTENVAIDPDQVDDYKKKLKNLLTKEEKRIKEKMAGKPDKPPSSAYGLFTRTMLATQQIQSLNPKERLAAIANMWKSCTHKEKAEYREKLKHMLEQYKLEYATYLESLSEEERLKELASNAPKPRKKPTKSTESNESEMSPEGIADENEPNEPDIKQEIDIEMEGVQDIGGGTVEDEDTKPVTKSKSGKKKAASPVRMKKEPVEPEDSVYFHLPEMKALYPGEPEPPPVSPMLLFAKIILKSHKHITKKELDHMWSEMSIEEKQKYRNKLNDMKKKYINNYEKFLKSLTQEQLKEYSKLKAAKLQETQPEMSESEYESEYDEDDSSSSTNCSGNSSGKSSSEEDSEEDSSDDE